MIILKKRKIVLFNLICCLILFMLVLVSNNGNVENGTEDEVYVETVSLPVTNKVIVIDARTWFSR